MDRVRVDGLLGAVAEVEGLEGQGLAAVEPDEQIPYARGERNRADVVADSPGVLDASLVEENALLLASFPFVEAVEILDDPVDHVRGTGGLVRNEKAVALEALALLTTRRDGRFQGHRTPEPVPACRMGHRHGTLRDD